jgi:hypothetical protein
VPFTPGYSRASIRSVMKLASRFAWNSRRNAASS